MEGDDDDEEGGEFGVRGGGAAIGVGVGVDVFVKHSIYL